LKNEGIIKEESKSDAFGGILRVFSLAPRGIEEVQEMLKDKLVNEQYQLIRKVKREFNSMSVVGLVEFTHREYSEYVGHNY
jgi:hypothetical protein